MSEDNEDDLHNAPREKISERTVLPPEKLHKRVNYILQKLIIEHSPKEVADILFAFINQHYSGDRRIDLSLKDFVDGYDEDKKEEE